MLNVRFFYGFVPVFILFLFLAGCAANEQDQGVKLAVNSVDVERCYTCHTQIKDLHVGNKHESVNCIHCHGGLDQHLQNPKDRPETRIDHMACGSCHEKQYASHFAMNWERPARLEKSQQTSKSPNPAWDLLMMPHGFTREHNAPRSHAFALLDQFLIDRAFGGRFQPKDNWQYLALEGDFKVWDVLVEAYTADEQRPYKHGTGAFANPVCFSCKTQDHILDWAYMGEPNQGAKWDRTSKPYVMAKELNHSVNCYTCHDPHAAKPRIVRDALIQALIRDEGDTLWHQDPNRTNIQVIDMGVRGYTRKIGLLDKYDGKLQCGQCHVEYNCNPGINLETGERVTMADPLSNYFPLVDVWKLGDHYDGQNFRDWPHGVTGAKLVKLQHPDAETFWNSAHDRAGVDCMDCHMPRTKDKNGKGYTSHWQTNPRNYLEDTCLNCHTNWTAKQAEYVIESAKNHLSGKKRKAEFWLTRLINKFEEAKAVGVPEDVLEAARAKHDQAHLHWEWWTAEVSGGFHNIDQAKESLNTSMIRSMEGINLLQDAIDAKRGTTTKANLPLGQFVGVEPVR